MNVLVLGGTVFFGRHLVTELVARGHRVTTFNRGTHAVDTDLPLTRIAGDRTLGGVYNATSPRMRDLIDACRDDVATLPAVRWVDGEFLRDAGCEGWGDLPLWIPPGSPYLGLLDVDVTRAIDAGLRLRPIARTVHDTREWFDTTGRTQMQTGLDPHRETELLNQWNAAISS